MKIRNQIKLNLFLICCWIPLIAFTSRRLVEHSLNQEWLIVLTISLMIQIICVTANVFNIAMLNRCQVNNYYETQGEESLAFHNE
jgi:uncharacterized membrane protein YhaH (DUF805 family)